MMKTTQEEKDQLKNFGLDFWEMKFQNGNVALSVECTWKHLNKFTCIWLKNMEVIYKFILKHV